jgi:hypothetical protein
MLFNNLKLGLAAVVIILTMESAKAASKSESYCKTDEAATACIVKVDQGDGFGQTTALTIYYKGYLLGKGRAVAATGTINGVRFGQLMDQRGSYPNFRAETYPLTFQKGHVEVYFTNALGEYDSKYGRNFHFDF